MNNNSWLSNILYNLSNNIGLDICFNIVDSENILYMDNSNNLDNINNLNNINDLDNINYLDNSINILFNNEVNNNINTIRNSIIENIRSTESNLLILSSLPRRIPITSSISNNDYFSDLLNETFINQNNYKKYKKVTNKETITSLKEKHFNLKEAQEKNQNIICPISLTKFEEDDVIIELSCNHIFSKDDILKWLSEESNSCPICRKELDYEEIRINSPETSNNTDTSNNLERINNNQIYISNFFTSLTNNLENIDEIQLQDILLQEYNIDNLNNVD
jgi:hypothetical protein